MFWLSRFVALKLVLVLPNKVSSQVNASSNDWPVYSKACSEMQANADWILLWMWCHQSWMLCNVMLGCVRIVGHVLLWRKMHALAFGCLQYFDECNTRRRMKLRSPLHQVVLPPDPACLCLPESLLFWTAGGVQATNHCVESLSLFMLREHTRHNAEHEETMAPYVTCASAWRVLMWFTKRMARIHNF